MGKAWNPLDGLNPECGHACGDMPPFGFVPEDGCLIHDPAARDAVRNERWQAFDPMRYHQYGNAACPECSTAPYKCPLCKGVFHVAAGLDDYRHMLCEDCGFEVEEGR